MDISLIGLGKMGAAMGRRLIGSGHALTVYNRSREKASSLEQMGAMVASSAAQAVAAAPVTVLMLADAAAIRDCLFPASGPFPALAGRTVIQMGTISPEQSLAIQGDIEAAGGAYVEAPVLGGPPEAEGGRLHVIVGSTPQQFDAWRPVFQALAVAPLHAGPVGRASAFKLALNQILAAEVTAMAYSLALIRRSGIDVDQFLEVLRTSSLYAPQFEKKLPKMLARDFWPASFSAKHLHKDIGLVVGEGRRLGLDTASVEGIAAVVRGAVEGVSPDADYSAIYAVIDPAKD